MCGIGVNRMAIDQTRLARTQAMQCPHCNQEHPEGTQFCPMTGQKILIPEVCPECGTPVDPNWLYCSYCGQALIQAEGMSNQQEAQATGHSPAPVTTPGLSKTKTSFSKGHRLMIAGGIGVLVVMAIVVLIVVGSGKNNGDAAPAATPLPTPFVEAAGGIAFETTRDGNLGIYVMDADGSAQTRLTNDQAEDRDPAWSANGRKIAFTSMRDGDAEIYVMNADGSAQTRLRIARRLKVIPTGHPAIPLQTTLPLQLPRLLEHLPRLQLQ
jgi:hypothetical protein